MGDVQFDEQATYKMRSVSPTGIVGFLIKNGFVKDTASAHGILIVAAVCAMIGAIFIFSSAQKATELLPAPPPYGFTE